MIDGGLKETLPKRCTWKSPSESSYSKTKLDFWRGECIYESIKSIIFFMISSKKYVVDNNRIVMIRTQRVVWGISCDIRIWCEIFYL